MGAWGVKRLELQDGAFPLALRGREDERLMMGYPIIK